MPLSSVTAYLQVDVDSKAGFYMAGSIIIFGSLVFLPISLRSFCTPKVYELDQSDEENQTQIADKF